MAPLNLVTFLGDKNKMFIAVTCLGDKIKTLNVVTFLGDKTKMPLAP